jgi:hypothetical protein
MNEGFDLDNTSGAFALNATPDDETAAFEQRLRVSEQARNETTELRDTAVVLGLALEEVRPPEHVRSALLARIATTPQLPADEVAPARPAVAPVRHVAPRRRLRRAVWGATIAMAAGALAVATITAVSISHPPVSQESSIITASDARTNSTTTASGQTVSVVWSAQQGKAVAKVQGGSALQHGTTYELWRLTGGTAIPVGLTDGGDWVTVQGTTGAGTTLAVTVEPAQGSAQPTSAPIASVQLS